LRNCGSRLTSLIALSRLDIIVNNACQTIRRPPAYYRHLINGELHPIEERPEVGFATPCRHFHGPPHTNLPDNSPLIPTLQVVDAGYHSSWLAQLVAPATQQKKALEPGVADGVPPPHLADGATAGTEVAQVTPYNLPASALAALNTQVATVLEDYNDDDAAFPEGATDVHKQQLDLRTKNSWVLRLGEVSTPEAAEVMAVNALSPFVLNGKLRPLLEASPRPLRFIVNVSAMEGRCAS